MQFNAVGVDSPAVVARRLLAHVLDKPREWLVAHDDVVLSTAQLQQFQALAARALAHEPLAYILGQRAFYDLDLCVDARVLIPRPETEMLVELALRELKMENLEWKMKEDNSPFSILNSKFLIEIGVGSGAASIAIAKHLPNAQMRVVASDVSADALAVAQLNAANCGVADRITFYHGNLLAAIPAAVCQSAVVLIANLPYIARAEIDTLQPEIRDYEPHLALDGGEDGLDLVRELLRQIQQHIAAQTGFQQLRAAFFEIGASQGDACLHAAYDLVPNAKASILKDLARLDRVLVLAF